MIKILVVVDHAIGITGPHRNVVGSLNALSARPDVEVRLLTGKVDESEPYANRCEILLGFTPHEFKNALTNLKLLLKFSRDRDLIYVPTGLKSFLYSFALKGSRKLVAGPNVTGIPVLMNPYNPSPLMTMRMSNGWIEMSEVRVRECVRAGTSRERIHLVPHAIDVNRFNPTYCDRGVWAREGLNPNTLKIIHVGRMDKERKGIRQLVKTFRLLQERTPTLEADLILIGPDGPMLTPDLRSVPNLHLLGRRYGFELVQLLASSDIFLGASRYETFWFTPLEAMSCGIPVVVSTVGAVPSMVPEDGVQGRTVHITDAENRYLSDADERLCAALSDLVTDEQLRKKIGAAAREHVVQHFSEDRLGEDLVKAFMDVLTRD